MSVSFCLPHPVAVSAFMICRCLCACPSHYFSIHTCNTNNSAHITVTAYTIHRLPRQPHRHTKDDHATTNTIQTHRPSSKNEISLILQVNINGIKNKLEELKLLIHDTHADIIKIQESKLTPKANTKKVHNFTTVCTKGRGVLVVVYPLP